MMFKGSAPVSGALAGIVSAFAFTVIHHILISNIWFTAPIMMFAGGLCGLCIGWSYRLLVEKASIGSWLRYNLLYVAMLMLLGAASVIVFEPVVSMAELMASDGPPHELIGQALPMTLLFTVASSVVISQLYGQSWRHYGAVLLTSMVLVLLLGLNVSALGLVSVPRGSFYLVAEFLGLIVVINLIFVVVFLALERSGASRSLQPETGTRALESTYSNHYPNRRDQ